MIVLRLMKSLCMYLINVRWRNRVYSIIFINYCSFTYEQYCPLIQSFNELSDKERDLLRAFLNSITNITLQDDKTKREG